MGRVRTKGPKRVDRLIEKMERWGCSPRSLAFSILFARVVRKVLPLEPFHPLFRLPLVDKC